MRSRTAQWFECKVKYEKVMEDVFEAYNDGAEISIGTYIANANKS